MRRPGLADVHRTGRCSTYQLVPAFLETAVFRISQRDWGFDSDTLEQAREIVGGEKPGRFHVDEIRAEPFASGHTSRACGSLIRHAAGRIEDEAWPWAD
jgi:hypothetical protein